MPRWPRVPSPGLIAGLAAGGVAAASISAGLAFVSDHVGDPRVSAILLDWITLPYVLAGLVAWWRRPDSRFGPLMVAAGFANFVTTLSWADTPALYTLGQAVDLVPPILFLHVFLAYPSGRLERPLERALVAVGYIVAIGLELVRMALGEFGPRNLFELVSEPGAASVVRRVQLLFVAVLLVAGFAVLALRWRRATPALRRVVGLVVGPGALALLMIALLLVTHAVDGPALRTIQRLTFLVIGVAPLAFLFGLLRSRLAVGPLVLALGQATAPSQLEEALAHALRDPSLDVLYWRHRANAYATLSGDFADVPTNGARAVTRVRHEGRLVAALVHDPSLTEQPELLESVGAAAGLALENARLQADLRSSLVELAASRARIVRAGDDERRRLERNLHDGAQQSLLALSVSLGLLESRVRLDAPSLALLLESKQQLTHTLEGLRELAHGLHPAVLSDHGLAVALETVAARAPVPVRLDVLSIRLPEHVEVAAYYLVSEALANVAKHAGASEVSVVVRRDGGSALVEVADNGRGGADAARGLGLRGLTDRVEALEGRVAIESAAGRGTVIRAEVPCHRDDA